MTKYRTKRRSRTTTRRRTKRMRKSTAQRYFSNKMTYVDECAMGTSGQMRRVYALQQVTDVGAVHPLVHGFDTSPRWGKTYANYEEYAVKGLSIKWIPGNFKGGQSQNVSSDVTGQISSSIHTNLISPMFVYFDIDTYDTHAYTPQ